jgi:hypothetical protein
VPGAALDLEGGPGPLAGARPGYPKDGSIFPLVPDGYLSTTVQAPASSPFQPTSGSFDAEGRASGRLSLPPLAEPSLVGQTLTFVWLAGVDEAVPGYPLAPKFPVHASDPLDVFLAP